MESQHFTFIIIVLVVSMVVIGASPTSDSAKDKQECTEQLVGLATCLPYVGGDAKAPTPDCCSGLKQVLQKNKKCLCVIIKDRNNPDLGLNINATLALALPSVCHAPANVSQCPGTLLPPLILVLFNFYLYILNLDNDFHAALLHLPPNSPDAQVFYQFTNGSSYDTVSSTPATSKLPTTSIHTTFTNLICFSFSTI